MKKEKTVRTYQRRTKSGKMVTVREHKASYDAAEEMRKAAAKKIGAGTEFVKKKTAPPETELPFTPEEFKEWYHWDMEDEAKNKSALKVEKALKSKMGTRAYKKYLQEMTDSYTARGHNKAHKALMSEYFSEKSDTPAKVKLKTSDKSTMKSSTDKTSSAKTKESRTKVKVSKSEFTQPPHSIKYKYKGETYYIKRKNVGGLIYKPTDVLNSKGVKLSKDEAAIIKAAQQKSAERADKRMNKRSNVDKKAKTQSSTTPTKNRPKVNEPISEQSLNSKGFKTFKMPQIGTLYLGKRGKGAYIKFKGKKNIQKATIDDYEDFITGHNGLTKAQKKQLSSLGYTEHEEY